MSMLLSVLPRGLCKCRSHNNYINIIYIYVYMYVCVFMWPYGLTWTYIDIRAHVFSWGLRYYILRLVGRGVRPLFMRSETLATLPERLWYKRRILDNWYSITRKPSQMVMPCGALWYTTFGCRKQSMYNCLMARPKAQGAPRKTSTPVAVLLSLLQPTATEPKPEHQFGSRYITSYSSM